jgi:hypothetical protein
VFFVLVGSLFGRTSVVFSDLFYRRYVDHALSKSDRGKKSTPAPLLASIRERRTICKRFAVCRGLLTNRIQMCQ